MMINGLLDTARWVVDRASSFQHNLARSRSGPVEVDEKYKLRENTNFRRVGQILDSLSADLFTHRWYVTFVARGCSHINSAKLGGFQPATPSLRQNIIVILLPLSAIFIFWLIPTPNPHLPADITCEQPL